MARGKRSKVGTRFIMQPVFHSFKATKYIFGVIGSVQGSLCADRPNGCSGLIRVLATMNRVPLFVLLLADCKIKIPACLPHVDRLLASC